MPLQNRVTPEGAIVATPHRGLMMGNRGGCFHRPDRTLLPRHWATRQWIACVLQFKDRRRRLMQPDRYTELFFLDEATALAAGHRPCFECRRADARRFAELWAAAQGLAAPPRAPAMDQVLQAERVGPMRAKATYRADLAALPDGSFVRGSDGAPYLVDGHDLLPWTLKGYGAPRPRPHDAVADVLTPGSIVAVLSAGYRPMLHPTAARRPRREGAPDRP